MATNANIETKQAAQPVERKARKSAYPKQGDWVEMKTAFPYRLKRRDTQTSYRGGYREFAVTRWANGGEIIFQVPENQSLAEQILSDCACERDWSWRVSDVWREKAKAFYAAQKAAAAAAWAAKQAEKEAK